MDTFAREKLHPPPPGRFLLEMFHFEQSLRQSGPRRFYDTDYGTALVHCLRRLIVPNRACPIDGNEIPYATLRRLRSPMEREINRPLSQNCATRESAIRFNVAVEGEVQSVGSTGSQTTKTRTALPATV
jgi:hypothetical protein